MSTIIMSACWPLQGLTPAQKAVLISLADNANDEGVCWPSVAKIAERTCLSERAVQQAIKVLNECKALSIEARQGRSTMFTVTPAAFAPPQKVHPRRKCTPAASAPRTVIEPT
ncbi:TPA: helix-turn-helix domain-containing protein, partial [Pseudomonas aeruginosa]|nr:helix-turn-helix domain-containing protein [Pseudomonas aeruginosa]